MRKFHSPFAHHGVEMYLGWHTKREVSSNNIKCIESTFQMIVESNHVIATLSDRLKTPALGFQPMRT